MSYGKLLAATLPQPLFYSVSVAELARKFWFRIWRCWEECGAKRKSGLVIQLRHVTRCHSSTITTNFCNVRPIMAEETSMVEVTSIVVVDKVVDTEPGIDQADEPERADPKFEERGRVEVAAVGERHDGLLPWWSIPLVLIACGPLLFLAGIAGGAIVSAVLLGMTCYVAHRVQAETGQGEARERGTRKHNVRARHGQNQSQVQGDTAYKDRFAWAMVAIAVGLTVAGTAAAYVGKHNRWSTPFTELPIPLAALLAWAVTLPRGCSPWPVFVIVMLIMPYATAIGSIMDTLSWGAAYHNYLLEKLGIVRGSWGKIHATMQQFLFYSAGTHGTICLPFYLGLHAARDFLRREYSDPVAAAGLPLRVGSEIAGALVPVVLYLSLHQYSGIVVEGAMKLQYSEHTPWCQKLPQGISYDFSVPFTGCNLWSDLHSGSAFIPSYTVRNATTTTALEYVWSDPNLLNTTSWHSSWTTFRRGAPPLSYNDTMRFEALEKFEKEGPPVTSAARYQGNAIIFGMFSSQIFARVMRVSFLDAVRFSVSYAEATALASTFLLLVLAFFTLGSKIWLFALYDHLFTQLMAFILLVLLFSLWRIAVYAKTTKEVEEEEGGEEERRKGGEKGELAVDQADGDFTNITFLRPRRASTDGSARMRDQPAQVEATLSSDAQRKVEALEREVELACKEATESKQGAETVKKENAELKSKVAKATEERDALQRMVEEMMKESEQLKREVAEAKASHAKDMVAILSRIEVLEQKAGSAGGSTAQC